MRYLNAFALTAVITVNALANILPIGGKTTGELSRQYPNLFVPAGFTFSIWGVIYLFLIGFVIYGFIGKQARADVARVGWLFVGTCVANVSWILAWHYEYTLLSVGIMLAFLALLIAMYYRMHGSGYVGYESTRRHWLFVIPISVYLGWITVATIANVTAVLVDFGWGGFGLPPYYWAFGMIVVATFLTNAVLRLRLDYAYSLVVAWALVGIWAARSGDTTFGAENVASLALISLAFLLFRLVTTAWRDSQGQLLKG